MKSYLPQIIFFLINLFACPAHGQQQKGESHYTKLLDSARSMATQNPQLCIKIALELDSVFVKMELTKEVGICYLTLGGAYYQLGEHIKSRHYYGAALGLAEEERSDMNRILAYRGITANFLGERNYQKADSLLQLALLIAQKNEYFDQVSALKQLMGVNEFYQHKFADAAVDYLEAMRLAKKYEPSRVEWIRESLIGVYIKANLLDLAMDELRYMKEFYTKTGNKLFEGYYHLKRGEIYGIKKSYRRAIEEYKKAIPPLESCQHTVGISHANLNAATIFGELGELENMMIYGDRAFDLADKTQDLQIIAYCYHLRGNAAFLQGKLDVASGYLEESFQLAAKIQEFDLMRDVLELKYQIEEKRNNVEASFRLYKQFIQIKDSLLDMENSSKVEGIILRNTLEIMEKDRGLKITELKRAKIDRGQIRVKLRLVWTVAILFTLVLLITYFFRLSKLKRSKELALKNESIQKIKGDVATLKLEKAEILQKQLKNELSYKNNRVKSLAQSLNKKNELLNELTNESLLQQDKKLIKKVKSILGSEEERKLLNTEIDEIDSNFHVILKEKFPELTGNDLKLVSMLKIGLSSKEIAAILSISSSSVDVARSRLRKKMELGLDQNLTVFLNGVNS
ncbi:MAG: hypothetical protein HRT58_13755 [Crocinitomicaceae bacterium]|nr:LuxR C-terminal-related transcriptional regulator [Flavobacteriales bacterium]NQZ36730.1 hypothetical protein [Crocinitomicaceae bacterium]